MEVKPLVVFFTRAAKKTRTGSIISSFDPFTFNTGGINLISGQQYIAFLSGFQFFDGVDGGIATGATDSDVYSGGDAIFLGNGTNTGSDFITINKWNKVGNGLSDRELAFKANLTSASAQPVPEPSSSLGLLAFGGFVAGKILKRKKAQLKIESQNKE
jgi:PEP-CTERM motif